MKRIIALSAFGAGYVFGARAGRERYDQLMGAFDRVRRNPRVQEQAHHLAGMAKEQAPGIKEKVGDMASAVASKAHHSSGSDTEPSAAPAEQAWGAVQAVTDEGEPFPEAGPA